MSISVKDLAPDFSLFDQNATIQKLSDYRGQWVLLYFYPKDATPGCTIEACSLRDMMSDFSKVRAIILGVSPDSIESHKEFARMNKLQFPLLADTEKIVIHAYGVFDDNSFNKTNRTSFLINPLGVVAKVYEGVSPKLHAQEVITDIKNFV